MANPIIKIFPLGTPWQTEDPFLFCVYHFDEYPKGNSKYGPVDNISNRNIGQDFDPSNSFKMYHGNTVPGFPAHPHRGFETVTVVRQGVVDHSDSMGAAGRYMGGDTQWLTAGKGIQHSEMFPLIHKEKDNHLLLFQIWLNLPSKNKMCQPAFKMLWNEDTPDYNDKAVSLNVIAGRFKNIEPPSPPKHSWANDKNNQVSIWVIEIKGNSEFELPSSLAEINKNIYFYEGKGLKISNENESSQADMLSGNGYKLRPESKILLKNTSSNSCKLLLLQGRPISEPVAQYGPFVMNSQAEIQKAFLDYQKDQFGGWPWKSGDPVHGPENKRFAKHADGRSESPG